MELSTILLLAALSTASPPATPANLTPAIIVRAERLVCRPVTRTGTRIGTNAVCRTEGEESVRPGQYVTLDEADAKLKVISQPCGCN